MQSSNEGNVSTENEAEWNDTLKSLEAELDPHVYAAYIQPLKLSGYSEEESTVTVSAPSGLVRRHVEDKFRDKIVSALQNKLGVHNLKLRFSVATTQQERRRYVVVKKVKNADELESGQEAGSIRNTGLNPKYTFANYVVGSHSQFCHAAAARVVEDPGSAYNPLFIYGGVGLGKTHLLHAIGNATVEQNPSAKVLYISSETFTNELIEALRNTRMNMFKDKFRAVDLLLVDDIQFIAGKESTQEEFFHTFNALYGAKRQIVITSDKVPQQIPGIEERLKTRFASGLTADLQTPDFETRVAILNRKAGLEGYDLPEDVAHFIASKISTNVRELEGALIRVYAKASIEKVAVSKSTAESALEQIIRPKPIAVTIDDIKKMVASHFNLRVSDLTSKRRTRNIAFPRHIAMFLCRKFTPASFPEIGQHFGGRDHSSVIHATNVITNKIKDDIGVKEVVKALEKMLSNR